MSRPRRPADSDASVFIYAVDRDVGFAPNPFHGYCTLATCKARVRKAASIGDWVIGMGGSRLKASGRCIFAMKVSRTETFDDYWNKSEYLDKKPVRNGSRKMMVGDNIYHRHPGLQGWVQANSHHSHSDGSTNEKNLESDTRADRVLLSAHFYYFGRSAPFVPKEILSAIDYKKNPRDYRRIALRDASPLIAWIESNYRRDLNCVTDDPFDFMEGGRRYSPQKNKIV